MNYLRFIRAERRWLGFGFLLAFFSSFGQTFFLSLFNGEFQEAFDLSAGDIGMTYMVATMGSGTVLIWLGRHLDRFSLRAFTLAVCVGLLLGCLAMGMAQSALWLMFGFFLMRLFGQGLLTHTAVVSMARFFRANRGKAVSVAAMGHPAGEAILPLAGVAVLEWLDWRWSWLVFAVFIVLVLMPLVVWLLAHGERQPSHADVKAAENEGDNHWRAGEVIRDPIFYLVLIYTLAAPFLLTGFFFHQVALVEEKGWTLKLLAGSFPLFAAATVILAFIVGHWIDRFSAQRVLPFNNIPLALALLALAFGDAVWLAPLYLALAGASVGAARSVGGAIWAEIYGTRHLGAIRALASAAMVYSTAAAPGIMGVLIDRGVPMADMALAGVAYIALATVIVLPVMWRRSRALAA